MKADAAPVLAIVEKKMRLEVPLFQRQYVWSRDQEWEPLVPLQEVLDFCLGCDSYTRSPRYAAR